MNGDQKGSRARTFVTTPEAVRPESLILKTSSSSKGAPARPWARIPWVAVFDPLIQTPLSVDITPSICSAKISRVSTSA